MTLLIAEIGNNHFGDIKRFKDLIRIAKESGADLVKGQLFGPFTIKGSMPREFYEKCYTSSANALDLMYYADSIGIDLFFSVFSDEFKIIENAQKFHKLSAGQTSNMPNKVLDNCDRKNYFISLKYGRASYPTLVNAFVLMASDYLDAKSTTDALPFFKTLFPERNIGYSDHTVGIYNCVRAAKEYGVAVIEKHFCLKHNEAFNGSVFRDTVHGATPEEFYQLSKEIEK